MKLLKLILLHTCTKERKMHAINLLDYIGNTGSHHVGEYVYGVVESCIKDRKPLMSDSISSLYTTYRLEVY